MGHRNHLHVCQHCGIVHATSSAVPPTACAVCEAFTFSEYELNDLLEGPRTHEPSDEQTERPLTSILRP